MTNVKKLKRTAFGRDKHCDRWSIVASNMFQIQSEQKFEKNCPILGNVSKTIAKLQKLKLKVENSCIKNAFRMLK